MDHHQQPAAAANLSTLAASLTQIAGLFQSGMLTEAEFAAAKSTVLGLVTTPPRGASAAAAAAAPVLATVLAEEVTSEPPVLAAAAADQPTYGSREVRTHATGTIRQVRSLFAVLPFPVSVCAFPPCSISSLAPSPTSPPLKSSSPSGGCFGANPSATSCSCW